MVNIGPSRQQLQAEIEQLKKANEILEENLRRLQRVEQLEKELEKHNRPSLLQKK